MYHVSFPKLGIKINVERIAFATEKITIYWYGLILVSAMILAFLLCLKKCKVYNISKEKFVDVFFCMIIFGIIFARIYYIIFYPGDFYWKNPEKIWCINEGGIAIYGAIIGGIIGGFLVSSIHKISFLSVLNVCSFGLFLGQSIGRWGNFFNQEAFGSTTNFFLAMQSENTAGIPVHPCFLYESVWCLMGLILLEIIYQKSEFLKKNVFYVYGIWYSLGRFFIEILRTDSLMFFSFKVSQILSGVIFLCSSIIFIIKYKINSKKVVKHGKY